MESRNGKKASRITADSLYDMSTCGSNTVYGTTLSLNDLTAGLLYVLFNIFSGVGVLNAVLKEKNAGGNN